MTNNEKLCCPFCGLEMAEDNARDGTPTSYCMWDKCIAYQWELSDEIWKHIIKWNAKARQAEATNCPNSEG